MENKELYDILICFHVPLLPSPVTDMAWCAIDQIQQTLIIEWKNSICHSINKQNKTNEIESKKEANETALQHSQTFESSIENVNSIVK